MTQIAASAATEGPAARLQRAAVAVVVAAAVTLTLYTIMAALVAAGRAALTESPQGRIVDFVRLQKEPELEVERPKPKKPDKPDLPPSDIAPPSDNIAQASQAAPPKLGPMTVDGGIGVNTGFGLSASDGEYLPIVKVAPIYPSRAQSRGIEGWVLLEFTVAADGSVINPVVVEAKPPGIFDRAALQAVRKFQYKPRMRDGNATAVQGVQHLITFEIED